MYCASGARSAVAAFDALLTTQKRVLVLYVDGKERRRVSGEQTREALEQLLTVQE